MPGIKIGRSKAQLPLRVEVEEISVPEGFTRTLSDHLLLVYTGKTRLARNLLQVTLLPFGFGSLVPAPLRRCRCGAASPKPPLSPASPAGRGEELVRPAALHRAERPRAGEQRRGVCPGLEARWEPLPCAGLAPLSNTNAPRSVPAGLGGTR